MIQVQGSILPYVALKIHWLAPVLPSSHEISVLGHNNGPRQLGPMEPYKQMLLDNGRCGTWEKLGFRCTGAPGSNTSTLSDSHVVTHIFPTCGRGKPPRSAAISAPPSAPSQASNSWRSGAVVVQKADGCHPFCPRRSGQAGFSPKSQ